MGPVTALAQALTPSNVVSGTLRTSLSRASNSVVRLLPTYDATARENTASSNLACRSDNEFINTHSDSAIGILSDEGIRQSMGEFIDWIPVESANSNGL